MIFKLYKIFNPRIISASLVIALLLIVDMYAQEMNFKHLTSDDGLSQNFVSCILQDQKGFMWFGTKDGLNRYDGYQFKIFRNNPFDTTTISNNWITSLFEDKDGKLWIGSSGLDVFDPVTEIVTRINIKNRDISNFRFQVQAINQDKYGNIWIGTSGGLYVYNPSTKNYKQYKNIPGDSASLSDNIVRSIYIDDELICLGTGNGLNLVNSSDIKSGKIKFKRINLTDDNGSDLTNITLSTIYKSSNGIFYAGTPRGLLKINLSNHKYKLFEHEKGAFQETWKGRIISICSDKNNNLWLASSGALIIFNTVTEKYNYIFQDPSNNQSINFNGVLYVYSDHSGKIWVGTPGKGINIYNQYQKEFKLYNGYLNRKPFRSAFSVNSILLDSKKSLWIVAGGDLYVLDKNRNSYKKISLSKIKNSSITKLVEDHEKDIWFVTDNGFFKLDITTNNVIETNPIKINPNQSTEISRFLFKDSKGNLWFSYGDQLSKFEKDSNSFTDINLDLSNNSANQISSINYIYENSDGQIWLAISDKLVKVDPANNEWQVFPHKINNGNTINYYSITCIAEDPTQPKKYLWMGTLGGGLIRFDLIKNTFAHFLAQDGLPNNIIYGLLSSHNELWLSTNNGLSRVKTDKYGQPTFRNYDISDGLQGNEFNTGAFYRNKDGEMFFGGLYGVTAFYPDRIRDNIFVPPISLIDLTILNPSEDDNKSHAGEIIPIVQRNEVTLPYSQNSFTINFTSLDFTATQKNKYIYQLKELNKSPVEIGTQRSVTFTDLSTGEYEFFVKGSNNDDIWNDEGASIKIIIKPPFWKTGWAYSIYFLFLISILLMIRKYEMNRIKLKNNLKQESFEREKLKELDALKSRFFTNISHEFRTPLTLIMGPAQQLEVEEFDQEKRSKLAVIKKNANRLLRLINQLLDISKIESGSSKIKCCEGDLVAFIKGIVNSFIPLSERKNVILKFYSSEKELFSYFDKDVVEKIFYNLISNAFKFTLPQGTIEINLTLANDKNNYCKISIKDSGMGISKDKLNLIFNKFYQATLNQDNFENGTGIGLAFVKELVGIHHGSISVESEIGKGSEFIVSLPIGKDYLSDEEILADDVPEIESNLEGNLLEMQDEIRETNSSELNNDSLIILVVEDNLDVQLLICKQLQKEYKTVTAINGKEGFDKAIEIIPDLVISDLMMPDFDGIELCNKLKNDERTSHIPIIILTAKADEADKIEGLATGVDDYLTKPFSLKELQLRVKNLIEIRKKLRQKFSSSIVLKPKEINASSVDKLFLEKALSIVETNINNESFTVKDFSQAMNLSHSQLHRKLKALTNQSANHFIRSVRMERALELLKSNAGNIADIAYLVGFNDPGYFTKIFSSYFGYLPSEVNTHI